MLEKQYRGNLTQYIVQSLGKAITVGIHPQGESLKSESELCQVYQASRTVLREAIKMLTAKGMLEARPKRGTLVLPESNWNLSDPDILHWILHRKDSLAIIEEFLELRLALEPAAAALATTQGSDEDKAELNYAITRMQAAESGEDDALDADIAFHVGLLKASGNRFFWNMRHTVEVALRYSIHLTNQFKGVERASIEDHQRILACILAGDDEAAKEATHSLLLEAKVLVNQARQKRQINQVQKKIAPIKSNKTTTAALKEVTSDA